MNLRPPGRGKERDQDARATRDLASSKRSRRLLLRSGFGILVVLLTIANWRVTTRTAIGSDVQTREIALVRKAGEFLQRHRETKQLVADILADAPPEQPPILTIFGWVQQNIGPAPPGWTVTDDHVLSTIRRGYGISVQRTEAFALLASYAGMPATAVSLSPPDGEGWIDVSIVEINEQRFLFDVVRGLAPGDGGPSLIPVDQLAAWAAVPGHLPDTLAVDGIPYRSYLAGAAGIEPSFRRMQMQKPWARLKFETAQLLEF